MNDFTYPPYTHDEDLLTSTRADGVPRVRVYRPDETFVVLGRGSDPAREVHLDACRADGVPILRRRGGGCSVVVDPGNVIVSVTLAVPGLGEIRSTFERCVSWLIKGLEASGVEDVRAAGISDLAIGDRKVAGSCVFRSLGLFFFSSTLLVSPDIDRVERYLTHPPREPAYRRGRGHRAFMGSIGGTGGADADGFHARLAVELDPWRI